MRSKIDKLFIKVGGRELIFYALKTLQDCRLISEIIITSSKKNIPAFKEIAKRYHFKKVKEVVEGGRERSESVFNGILKVSDSADTILVHDGARPFVTKELIKKTIDAAKRCGASLSAIPAKPTIKEAKSNSSFVKKTLDRRLLWEAQTPQVFRKDILSEAYRRSAKKLCNFTDDASLVEKINKPVKLVKGDYNNIKITTPDDLITAEAIIKTRKL
jgi:2-C-methyl-D-erythritol 4-phosphate cytidylyltransferase